MGTGSGSLLPNNNPVSDLNDRGAGMRGGGQGECQLNDGRTIQAAFPAA